MNDRLKEFIDQHRQEFDQAKPPANLWDRLDKDLNQAQGNPVRPLWQSTAFWRVAAMVLLGLTSLLWVERSLRTPANPDLNEASMSPDLGQLCELINDPEFCQAQMYYSEQIVDRRKQVVNLAGAHPDLMNDFLADVDTLSMLYDSLAVQYAAESENEVLQMALLSNLRLQLDILDRQIRLLEKMEAYYNKEGDENEDAL